MDFALQVEPPPFDREKAKRLLAEAGYPNGRDAGDFIATPGFPTVAETIVNDLAAIGIRVRLRSTERATFLSDWRDKKLRGLVMTAVGSAGNAASRVEDYSIERRLRVRRVPRHRRTLRPAGARAGPQATGGPAA